MGFGHLDVKEVPLIIYYMFILSLPSFLLQKTKGRKLMGKGKSIVISKGKGGVTITKVGPEMISLSSGDRLLYPLFDLWPGIQL